jgi:hypothetical protein
MQSLVRVDGASRDMACCYPLVLLSANSAEIGFINHELEIYVTNYIAAFPAI